MQDHWPLAVLRMPAVEAISLNHSYRLIVQNGYECMCLKRSKTLQPKDLCSYNEWDFEDHDHKSSQTKNESTVIRDYSKAHDDTRSFRENFPKTAASQRQQRQVKSYGRDLPTVLGKDETLEDLLNTLLMNNTRSYNKITRNEIAFRYEACRPVIITNDRSGRAHASRNKFSSNMKLLPYSLNMLKSTTNRSFISTPNTMSRAPP